MTFLEYAKIVDPKQNAQRRIAAYLCPSGYGLPDSKDCLSTGCRQCYAREVPYDLVCRMIESGEYDVPHNVLAEYGYVEHDNIWGAAEDDELLRLIGGTYG